MGTEEARACHRDWQLEITEAHWQDRDGRCRNFLNSSLRPSGNFPRLPVRENKRASATDNFKRGAHTCVLADHTVGIASARDRFALTPHHSQLCARQRIQPIQHQSGEHLAASIAVLQQRDQRSDRIGRNDSTSKIALPTAKPHPPSSPRRLSAAAPQAASPSESRAHGRPSPQPMNLRLHLPHSPLPPCAAAVGPLAAADGPRLPELSARLRLCRARAVEKQHLVRLAPIARKPHMRFPTVHVAAPASTPLDLAMHARRRRKAGVRTRATACGSGSASPRAAAPSGTIAAPSTPATAPRSNRATAPCTSSASTCHAPACSECRIKICARKERTIADRRRSATRPTRRGTGSKLLPFGLRPGFEGVRCECGR